jgi:hypothetical protein
MNNETKNTVLFNYIEETQSNSSIGKRCVFGGLFLVLTMIIFKILYPIEELTLMYVIKMSSIYLAAGIVWSGSIYLFFKWFEKRLMENKSQDLIEQVPDSIGTLLSKIGSNVTRNSIALGGMLFIGNKGFAFIPHKYNSLKPDHKWGSKAKGFDFQWNQINAIYKSTGSFSFRHLFNGALVDRLAIEVGEQSYFFVINQHLDRVIDDLNDLRDSRTKH